MIGGKALERGRRGQPMIAGQQLVQVSCATSPMADDKDWIQGNLCVSKLTAMRPSVDRRHDGIEASNHRDGASQAPS